jgi:hypothetical protein
VESDVVNGEAEDFGAAGTGDVDAAVTDGFGFNDDIADGLFVVSTDVVSCDVGVEGAVNEDFGAPTKLAARIY